MCVLYAAEMPDTRYAWIAHPKAWKIIDESGVTSVDEVDGCIFPATALLGHTIYKIFDNLDFVLKGGGQDQLQLTLFNNNMESWSAVLSSQGLIYSDASVGEVIVFTKDPGRIILSVWGCQIANFSFDDTDHMTFPVCFNDHESCSTIAQSLGSGYAIGLQLFKKNNDVDLVVGFSRYGYMLNLFSTSNLLEKLWSRENTYCVPEWSARPIAHHTHLPILPIAEGEGAHASANITCDSKNTPAVSKKVDCAERVQKPAPVLSQCTHPSRVQGVVSRGGQITAITHMLNGMNLSNMKCVCLTNPPVKMWYCEDIKNVEDGALMHVVFGGKNGLMVTLRLRQWYNTFTLALEAGEQYNADFAQFICYPPVAMSLEKCESGIEFIINNNTFSMQIEPPGVMCIHVLPRGATVPKKYVPSFKKIMEICNSSPVSPTFFLNCTYTIHPQILDENTFKIRLPGTSNAKKTLLANTLTLTKKGEYLVLLGQIFLHGHDPMESEIWKAKCLATFNTKDIKGTWGGANQKSLSLHLYQYVFVFDQQPITESIDITVIENRECVYKGGFSSPGMFSREWIYSDGRLGILSRVYYFFPNLMSALPVRACAQFEQNKKVKICWKSGKSCSYPQNILDFSADGHKLRPIQAYCQCVQDEWIFWHMIFDKEDLYLRIHNAGGTPVAYHVFWEGGKLHIVLLGKDMKKGREMWIEELTMAFAEQSNPITRGGSFAPMASVCFLRKNIRKACAFWFNFFKDRPCVVRNHRKVK